MNTPIADFIDNYIASDTVRAHMPGHKGVGDIEKYDITEVFGADSLFHADGIIAQSERNASEIFGAPTFYSTEGSSLCIRAMLYLVALYKKRKPLILAGRNAHKSFISACALVDASVEWMYGQSYLLCDISPKSLEARFKSGAPVDAVYITSPDYLGNVQDIEGISKVCKKYGVLLLVDNAHGAYLKALGCHPIDLGADLSCDSAHKTLAVLTGGAYLHIGAAAPDAFVRYAKTALSLFASTSPSYLILRSLDKANGCFDEYSKRLLEFLPQVYALKEYICSIGLSLFGNEALKITVMPKQYGYDGVSFASELRKYGVECEFCDPDYTVLMLCPENGDGVEKIKDAISRIVKRSPITDAVPKIIAPQRVMELRQAVFMPYETVAVADSVGRISAGFNASCPPAVQLVVAGEIINESVVKALEYYGNQKTEVLL